MAPKLKAELVTQQKIKLETIVNVKMEDVLALSMLEHEDKLNELHEEGRAERVKVLAQLTSIDGKIIDLVRKYAKAQAEEVFQAVVKAINDTRKAARIPLDKFHKYHIFAQADNQGLDVCPKDINGRFGIGVALKDATGMHMSLGQIKGFRPQEVKDLIRKRNTLAKHLGAVQDTLVDIRKRIHDLPRQERRFKGEIARNNLNKTEEGRDVLHTLKVAAPGIPKLPAPPKSK